MSGNGAASGDAITDAHVGVPHAAGPIGGSGDGVLCLNCGTRLLGSHCHACGQSGDVHRTIGAIGHEIAHGVFHFEGKIWRTLPLLVRHPGALTRRYVAGERARFLSPLALFLFTVFLMFATISAVGGELGKGLDNPAARTQLAAQLSEARGELARLEARRTALIEAGKDHAEIDSNIVAARSTISALAFTVGAAPDTSLPLNFRTGWSRLDHGIEKASANPGLALYKLQSSAYKYSWLLIPLSTPFVALLFLWRRRFGLYDHAIFVTYSLSFMMLLVIAVTLLGVAGVPGGWLFAAVVFIPPIHMFVQLGGAYSLRKRSALWRTIALLIFATIAITMFAVLLLLHGLAD